MTNPTRRDNALLPVALGIAATGRAEAQQMTVPVDKPSLTEVLDALGKGTDTSVGSAD